MIEISVIIPTYGRPLLLGRCLAALRDQLPGPLAYEVIVVSDGPDSESEKVCRQFPSQVRFVQLARKKGPAAARNTGWRKARGRLIAFTDDDTVPAKNWLSAFLDAYAGEESIAYAGTTIVPLPARPTDYEQNTARLAQAEFITANCCCTRHVLELVDGFDERFTQAWREDSDLHFRLLEAGVPVVKLTQAIVVHPVRKARWGISLKEQEKGVFNALLYKKFPALYRERIQPAPLWEYYLNVVLLLTLLVSGIAGSLAVFIFSLCAWFFLVARFSWKRLKHTTRTPGHITEMLVTSVVIPPLSVYWQVRGAMRYKVFFI